MKKQPTKTKKPVKKASPAPTKKTAVKPTKKAVKKPAKKPSAEQKKLVQTLKVTPIISQPVSTTERKPTPKPAASSERINAQAFRSFRPNLSVNNKPFFRAAGV